MRLRADEQGARRHGQPILGRKGEHQRFKGGVHAVFLKDPRGFGDCHFFRTTDVSGLDPEFHLHLFNLVGQLAPAVVAGFERFGEFIDGVGHLAELAGVFENRLAR